MRRLDRATRAAAIAIARAIWTALDYLGAALGGRLYRWGNR